jgi:hypothetical protein
METLKALLSEYFPRREMATMEEVVIPEYEESIELIRCTDLTYEYLVEGYYIVHNDMALVRFLNQ